MDPIFSKVSQFDPITRHVAKIDPVQKHLDRDPFEEQRKQVAAINARNQSLLSTK